MEESSIEFFERLMSFRIKKVLLVASLYDSFMFADDEMLSEVLFEHNLTGREHFYIRRANHPHEALEILQKEKFDIVISMSWLSDYDMKDFVFKIKEEFHIPFVLLSFSINDINLIDDDVKNKIDEIFLWQGDTRIFSSIINLIEDKINFENDIKCGVQFVLLVEDNIKFYSKYLPIIYAELIKQMHIVMSDELNISRKVLRLRARPKIILKKNYEDAWDVFERYNNNMLGVITDVEYPSKENLGDIKAGLLLAKKIKQKIPDMPVLVQSSNQEYEKISLEIGASFLNKNSGDLSKNLRSFIQRYFGFGDFIFDNGKGKEIARATDLISMLKILRIVPDESIIYHASRNHFSKWLLARTEFDIAYKIRPKKIEEFKTVSDVRKYLIESIHQFLYRTQMGSVLKFSREKYTLDMPFTKIGNGSIGGKARGIAFLDYLIGKGILRDNINGINIKTPTTVVIASDVFDFFIEHNNLSPFLNNYPEEEIAKIFENVNLPDYVLKDLMVILEKFRGPIALRSSSLLEDSKNYPFSGIYKTYMYRNNQKLYDDLKNVERMIKYIYASVYSKEANEFRKSNPNITTEEKMSVIIQQVVGREYINGFYFPLISGIIQSYNFYPVYPLTPSSPIMHIALGLGEAVVRGKYFLRYSPFFPDNIHQFATIEDIFKSSQKKFMAISLNGGVNLSYNDKASIVELDLDRVDLSDEMKAMFSSYLHAEDKMVDYYIEGGSNLLTFFPLIKNQIAPINETIIEISEICKNEMGNDVEIEFALNFDSKTLEVDLYLLQIKYLPITHCTQKINFELKDKKTIIYSKNAVGNAFIKNLQHILYVKRENFSNLNTLNIAKQISVINQYCRSKNINYLLIGPGRWGTSDIHLGIPVKWNDISMAKVIVEGVYGSFYVTPSYGTHFFHNMVALSIPYLFVDNASGILWDDIEKNSSVYETDDVRLVSFGSPFYVFVEDNNGYVVR
jgi:DNA-binding NarL/FixJ family response regulator